MRRICVLACLLVHALSANAQYQSDVGYSQLQSWLNGQVPNGFGVKATLVEAGESGTAYYMPNTQATQLAGKTFRNVSANSTGASGHATETASLLAGAYGMASGVANIDVYYADDWLTIDMLKTSTAQAPLVETSDVASFSWIGNYSSATVATDALRRLDWAVERDKFVAVVAVNNGAGSALPQLMGNAYNAISVGLTNGNSSVGPTAIDGVGRVKPDISVPENFTSNATPIVGATAALLTQAARQTSNTAALEPEMIKGFILGGATKREFDLTGATSSTLDDWTHTQTQPLDIRHGVGELNVFNSYNILTAGQQTGGSGLNVRTTGWDLIEATPSSPKVYYFDVLAGQTADDFNVVATWNRQITAVPDSRYPTSNPLVLTPSLANVDLRLYSANGNSLGTLIDQSISSVDNVENIYRQSLAPGRYAIEVRTDQAWDVALTWQAKMTGAPLITAAMSDRGEVVDFDVNGRGAPFADSHNGLRYAIDVTHDAAGNRYVLDSINSQVRKYDASGNTMVFADSSDGLLVPTSLAAAPDGGIFVANYLSSQIIRLDSSGHGTVFSQASEGLSRPFGIAVDAAGTVYAAEVDSQRIVRLDGAGNATVFADGADGLVTPTALTFGPDGLLYVVDTLQSTIFRFDALGNAMVYANRLAGLLFPTGLTFDANGNLYVSQYLSGTIVKIDGQNHGTLFASGLAGIWGIDSPIAQTTLQTIVAGPGPNDRLGDLPTIPIVTGEGITTVPEASSLTLCAVALGTLAALRRRVRRKPAA
jgi:hypothetical protein